MLGCSTRLSQLLTRSVAGPAVAHTRHKGLHLKAAYGQLKRVSSWLAQNDQITPTNEDYVSAAYLNAAARRQGLVVELPDCLIAAIASRLELTLVTGNSRDHDAIQRAGLKLRVIDWRQP